MCVDNVNVILTCFDVSDELILVKRRKQRKPSKVSTSLYPSNKVSLHLIDNPFLKGLIS